MKWHRVTVVVVVFAVVGVVFAQSAYTLDWWTVDGGGQTFSTAGDYALGSTIGQPEAAEPLAAEPYQLQPGFWRPRSTPTPTPTPTPAPTAAPVAAQFTFGELLIATLLAGYSGLLFFRWAWFFLLHSWWPAQPP